MKRFLLALGSALAFFALYAQGEETYDYGQTEGAVQFGFFESEDGIIVPNPYGADDTDTPIGYLTRSFHIPFPSAGLPEEAINQVILKMLAPTSIKTRDGAKPLETLAFDDVWEELGVDPEGAYLAPEGFDPSDIDGYMPQGGYDLSGKVLQNTPEVVSIEVDEYACPVGAVHGSANITYVNFSPSRGHYITLADYVDTTNPRLKKALAAQLQKAFRAYLLDGDQSAEARSNADTLIRETLEANGGQMPVSETIGILPGELVFQYQNYEIGPYALGAPALRLPIATLPK